MCAACILLFFRCIKKAFNYLPLISVINHIINVLMVDWFMLCMAWLQRDISGGMRINLSIKSINQSNQSNQFLV